MVECSGLGSVPLAQSAHSPAAGPALRTCLLPCIAPSSPEVPKLIRLVVTDTNWLRWKRGCWASQCITHLQAEEPQAVAGGPQASVFF